MGRSVHRFCPGANPCAIVVEGKVPGAFSDLPGKSMQKDGGGLLGQFHPPPSTGAASACSCSSVWKRGSSRLGSQTGWLRIRARKRVVPRKSVSERVDHGGCRNLKKKQEEVHI